MDKTKIIAVAMVIVIAIAGVSLMFVLNDKTEGDYVSADDTGRLTIFGNANNDDYLNYKDIEKIEDIIAGNCEATTFADANQDGVIDQKDIDFVQRMIDREEMNIFILQEHGTDMEIKSIEYPLKNACVAGVAVLNIMQSIDASSNIIALSGISDKALDPLLYSDLQELPRLGHNVFWLDPELVSNHEDIQVIVTSESANYLKNQDIFETAGIEVVRITASDGINSLAGIVTLGYLFDAEVRTNDVIEFFEGVLNTISNKVEAINDVDRVTSLYVVNTNYVTGLISDFFKTSELAGSKNLADWSENSKKFEMGAEWLLVEKYQSDYIIHGRTYGIIKDTETLQTEWAKSVYFDGMEAFNEGNYLQLNVSLTPVMRIAFMAQIFYPDLFDDGWAESMLQTYFDTFSSNLHNAGYKVSQGYWVVTQADIAAL